MTESSIREVRFSSPESEELGPYHPTNRLAIAAFFAALVSALTLIHPLFLIVTAVTLVLAVGALRPARAEWFGRSFAFVALMLTTYFASCGLAWYFSYQNRLSQESREHADTWLELIREGKLYEAHQLTKHHFGRESPGTSLEQVYRAAKREAEESGDPVGDPSNLANELEEFMSQEPMRKLTALEDFEAHCERHGPVERMSDDQLRVRHFYSIVPKDPEQDPINFVLTMQRAVENDVGYWRLENVAISLAR